MKRIYLGVVPALLVAAVVAPFALFWSRLPEPMAIHWGPTGDPNGSMPRLLALVVLAGALLAFVVGVWRTLRRSPAETRSFTAGLYGVGTVWILIAWLSVMANRDVEVWPDAGEVSLLHVALVLLVGFLGGVVGWFVAGKDPVEEIATAAPVLEIDDPSGAVWSGRGIGKITSTIGVVVFLIGLVVWGWTGVLFVVIAAVAMMFATVRVTISKRGAVVSMGWWGYPNWTVPLESIARAEVEELNPMAYGGWGYRVRPGVRAIVIRSGDALRLVREDRSDLVYTVDDAATGAGLVNSILQERSDLPEGSGDAPRVGDEQTD